MDSRRPLFFCSAASLERLLLRILVAHIVRSLGKVPGTREKSCRPRRTVLRRARKEVRHVNAWTSVAGPTPTAGEVFADNTMIEPIRNSSNTEALKLLCWDGRKSTIGSRVRHDGRVFKPATIDPTILRALRLPTNSASHGSPRQLLTALSATVQRYCGLAENFAMLAGHFVLASWLIGGIPTAPRLSILGPDALGGTQLLQLLHCLCRRSLMLVQVDVNGVCSLPMEWRPTLLIRQAELSVRLERLLSAARKRNAYVPRSGRLLDLHCTVVTYTELRGGRAHCTPSGIAHRAVHRSDAKIFQPAPKEACEEKTF